MPSFSFNAVRPLNLSRSSDIPYASTEHLPLCCNVCLSSSAGHLRRESKSRGPPWIDRSGVGNEDLPVPVRISRPVMGDFPMGQVRDELTCELMLAMMVSTNEG